MSDQKKLSGPPADSNVESAATTIERKEALTTETETAATPDAPVDPSPAESVKASGSSGFSRTSLSTESFPQNLPERLDLVLGQDGRAYSIQHDAPNPYALRVGEKALNNIIRQEAMRHGHLLRKSAIAEVNDFLQAWSECSGRTQPIWNRVAQIEDGVEIDLGDQTHTRVRLNAGRVTLVQGESPTVFFRPPMARPLVRPAERGDLGLLANYVNLSESDLCLFKGWVTYTIAHPKNAQVSYPILDLQGDQGSGKTSACKTTRRLVDPNVAPVQLLPTKANDLAIAIQNTHVVCFDNVRQIKPAIADALCIASTGGAIVARKLYTDEEQHSLLLHGAVVLNGIHAYVDQPDLAQRCVPIRLKPIEESARKSETVMNQQFEQDLPAILRGLYDSIAETFRYLPEVEVTDPERMMDFSRWLAAMERVADVPPGVYQSLYSYAIREIQLDGLLENALAAALLDFVRVVVNEEWIGTPSELLGELNERAPTGTQHSRDWPRNAISLSKRLSALQGGLASQGIKVTLGRGRYREITITKMEGSNHE